MKRFLKARLSQRSLRNLRALNFDWKRLKVRWFGRNPPEVPPYSLLNLGCGYRKVSGWLNVDLLDSDCNLDLATGKLPWKSASFDAVVSQHLIEHLYLEDELIPLLKEVRRVVKSGRELWLSTPDLEKICRGYLHDRCATLVAGRKSRMGYWTLGDFPPQHMMNHFFHQNGEHFNLFDFELLKWTLQQCGFFEIQRVDETQFLRRFPEFPARNDDEQALYIRAC